MGLLAFHLLLLWRRLADLSLFEPAVAARWALAVALILAARAIRLHTGPSWGDRRFLALFVAVLILHLPLAGPSAETFERTTEGPSQGTAVFLVPAILGLAIDLGQALARATRRWLRRRQDQPLGLPQRAHVRVWRPGEVDAGLWLHVRPPPA